MKFASAASPSLLIFKVPGLIAASGADTVTYALPLVGRQGGLLLAFPVGVVDEEAFPGTTADEDQMVGPAKTFEGIELYEEEDAGSGAIQAVGQVFPVPSLFATFWIQCWPIRESMTQWLIPCRWFPLMRRIQQLFHCMLKFWPRLLNGPEVNLRAESFFTVRRARSSRGLGESSRKEDFECSPCRTSFSPISPDEGAYEAAGHGRQWAISKDPWDAIPCYRSCDRTSATATGLKMPAVSQGLLRSLEEPQRFW